MYDLIFVVRNFRLDRCFRSELMIQNCDPVSSCDPLSKGSRGTGPYVSNDGNAIGRSPLITIHHSLFLAGSLYGSSALRMPRPLSYVFPQHHTVLSCCDPMATHWSLAHKGTQPPAASADSRVLVTLSGAPAQASPRTTCTPSSTAFCHITSSSTAFPALVLAALKSMRSRGPAAGDEAARAACGTPASTRACLPALARLSSAAAPHLRHRLTRSASPRSARAAACATREAPANRI